MTVTEHAQALGEAIKNDPIMQRYRTAKQAYDTNQELQQLMFEYNTQRRVLGEEFKKEPDQQNATLISLIRDRIDVLAKQIVVIEDYRQFSEAQQQVTELMNQVNSEIQFAVFGTRPCTHDCSTCQSTCASRE